SRHRLAVGRLGERRLHVVSRLWRILRARRWPVIDRPRIDDRALRVDDEHVRRGLGLVEPGSRAVVIDQDCLLRGALALHPQAELGWLHVAPARLVGRIDRQPDYVALAPALLKA